MSENQPSSADIFSSKMDLTFDESFLTATLRISGDYDPNIDYSAVIKLLNEHGVVYGVDTISINRLIEEFKSRKVRTPTGIIARGVPATAGIPGRIEILVEEPPPVTIDEEGRADFRNVHRFQTVQQNQVVAKRYPSIQGKPGTNLFGQVVPVEPIPEPEFEAKDHVKFNPASNEFVALKKGIFVKKENTIAISPVLTIAKNIGLETGNVVYDGDVKVNGNIERGSVVSAVGNLYVGGMVESGNVRCGGDALVRGGINTKKEGQININGMLEVGHLENANLTVEKGIRAHKSIIGCNIITYGGIEIPSAQGVVTGGEIYSFESISVANLGNKTGGITKIYLGVHQRNMKYYEIHSKELQAAEIDLGKKTELVNRIKIYVQRMRGQIPVAKQAEFRAQFNAYKDAKDNYERLNAQVQQLLHDRYNQNEVKVIVKNVVYPGVELHYKSNVEKITVMQTRCVFRFKPGQEKPVIEAYKG